MTDLSGSLGQRRNWGQALGGGVQGAGRLDQAEGGKPRQGFEGDSNDRNSETTGSGAYPAPRGPLPFRAPAVNTKTDVSSGQQLNSVVSDLMVILFFNQKP